MIITFIQWEDYKLLNLKKQIENTREKLNTLMENKEMITNDIELLEVSIFLDELINKYMHNENNRLAF
jgi:hypothetical protein